MAAMVSGSGRRPPWFIDQSWAGFIYLQNPVIQTYVVYTRDRSPGLFGTGHLNESKATGLTCITILYNRDTPYRTVGLEERSQLLLSCFGVKVSNENVRHGLNSPSIPPYRIVSREDENSGARLRL